jgi:hypothetical protein
VKRYFLFAGVGAALAIAPTAAFAGTEGDNYDDPITFENHVSTTLDNSSYQFNLTGMFGGVLIAGLIDPDSAANAITDAKQMQSDEDVLFTADPIALLCGKGAYVDNSATAHDVTSSGNVGVNVAAGQYNMQQNSANIAVSSDGDAEASGGWASAATTGYQSLERTSYGPGETYILNYPVTSPYSDTNDARGHAVSGDGNIGENVAAGAFNQQQNLMTIAVADNSILSQSNAALWQQASCNQIDVQDQSNTANSGLLSGAGNIGVNIAAGVGNQQQNSLTAAVSGVGGSAGGTAGAN